MKTIELSKGFKTIVDDDDFDNLNNFNWNINNYGYVKTNMIINNKKTTKVMHRFILNLNNPKIEVDHINGNKLDNRKENLRICTRQQNTHNQPSMKSTTSKFKGVSKCKHHWKWCAKIYNNKKYYWLGYFENEIDAAKAYNQKAIELFGEYAWLNKIEE